MSVISPFPTEVPCSSQWDWLDSEYTQGGKTEAGWGIASPGKCNGPENSLSYPREAIGDFPRHSSSDTLFPQSSQPRDQEIPASVDNTSAVGFQHKTGRPFSQCLRFPAKNRAAILANAWNTCKTEPPIPLKKRRLKAGSQVIWLGSQPEKGQQTESHWLEILAANTAV
ncbi:uncharacterized protein LOC119471643 [Cebus imitator]|uniref:uncharacterized protein LOC119471643 n=1 Tax=Cebus imitator TaxID=2715852 RepID=UPI00189C5074|nr:uncharacterized protein LOC119471643 [Cebus imitator]